MVFKGKAGHSPSRGLRVDSAGTLRGYRGGTGVRADGLRGLAGRGRGDPRVSSGSDTIGDPIPASGRYTLLHYAACHSGKLGCIH